MVIYNSSIFDPITNSEDAMIMQAHISKGQAASYLRAYIIIRLLFSHEFVITDSSICLNRALRMLILKEEGGLHYDDRMLADADFAQLIEDGTIKLASRDDYKGDFSKNLKSLRNVQNSKKHVTLPSEKYVDFLDGIYKEENIYWWNTDEVSKMFTKNIREGLETEFSDEVNVFLRELRYCLRDEELLTYDLVKKEALKRRSKNSEEYKIVHGLLRESYDYNIPRVLGLEYLKFFNNTPRVIEKDNFEINKAEEYVIPWPYGFNLYAFSLVPAQWLKIFWKSSEYIRYEKAMSQYRMGLISFGVFLDALKDYLYYIDQFITPLYNDNKHIVDTPKNLMVRFQEIKDGKHPIIVTTAAGLWIKNAITTGYDLFSDLTIANAIKFALMTMLPSMVFKVYDHFTAFPKIDHAIMKLDK